MQSKPLNLKPSAPEPIAPQSGCAGKWKLLIVDDEPEIHAVTRMILAKVMFKDRPLELLSAFSAEEAKAALREHSDIAAILLDVVMESDDAGLKLVGYIRDELQNKAVRIILRTGQPGQAPEERVIVDYDINDYKAKSELTAQKLFTSVIAALRAYETIMQLDKNRRGLEKILNSTDSLFEIHSMQEFASGILMQLSAFLECNPNGVICLEESGDLGQVHPEAFCSGMKILAATGEYGDCLTCSLAENCRHKEMTTHIRRAMDEHRNQYLDNYTVVYLKTSQSRGTAALVHSGGMADENDRFLLEVFASKVSIALENAIHYQKMITAEQAATTDFLTGLNNRRQLLRLALPMLAAANRAGSPLVVAMLDIDHFKIINDTHGHDVGDIVLKSIADLMKNRFRSSDVVARFGGEEFCVVAPLLDGTHVFELFDSFRLALEQQTIEAQGKLLNISVSIGVSTVLAASIDDMISAADELLYRAKNEGRNRVVIG